MHTNLIVKPKSLKPKMRIKPTKRRMERISIDKYGGKRSEIVYVLSLNSIMHKTGIFFLSNQYILKAPSQWQPLCTNTKRM